MSATRHVGPGDAPQVHVWAECDGEMPPDGRWCDEPERGAAVDVVFHRQARVICVDAEGASICACATCGESMVEARA